MLLCKTGHGLPREAKKISTETWTDVAIEMWKGMNSWIVIINTLFTAVSNHVKLIHVVNSRRGFSKGTVLCGGY